MDGTILTFVFEFHLTKKKFSLKFALLKKNKYGIMKLA